jgi:hypothetical protein
MTVFSNGMNLPKKAREDVAPYGSETSFEQQDVRQPGPEIQGRVHVRGFFVSKENIEDFHQLLELVLAIKLVISCVNSLLPHEGHIAVPVSCSFSVKARRHSLPHLRHLYSYRGISCSPGWGFRKIGGSPVMVVG